MLFALLTTSLVLATGMPRHEQVTASDGLLVDVDHWDRDDATASPVIVLFHQAGSNKSEYDTIVPRLFDRGYNLVVVSQRSGGTFGTKSVNTTAQRYKKAKQIKGKVPYIDALPDMRAAVAFAKKEHPRARIAIWGSSYSAALTFVVAAEDPEIGALLAFSPGEYFRPKKGAKESPRHLRIADAAAKVRVPVLILTPASEKKRAAPIARALPTPVEVVTPKGAVHGSSMLIPRKSKTASVTWVLVDDFLDHQFPVRRTSRPRPARTPTPTRAPGASPAQ